MWRLNEEDGVVAVVVAILLSVVLGFAAISVDVGQLYQERRELQNGADGAAVAAAYDCAKGVIECSLTSLELNNTVDSYASANANDAESAATVVELNLTDSYVTVETETLSNGDSFLTHWFAWIFGADSATTTVQAQATAKWGRMPGTLDIFPIAFCEDTFNSLTTGGTSFGPPEYHVFYKKVPPDPSIECVTTGGTYAGGFGWLDGVDPDCTMTISTTQWVPTRPGEALPNTEPWPTCVTKLKQKIAEMDTNPDAAPLLVPIFDEWRSSGTNGEFHIAGFGAFRPTGFNFGGTGDYYPDMNACVKPSNRCVRGWFTDFVTFGGVGSGGAYYGVVSVDLIK